MVIEGITHILTGILVQLLCFIYFSFPLNVIFTLIFGFFSHFIIDTLAKITYHTPEPHKEDKFWVAWHVITIALLPLLIIWIVFINWVLFFFFLLGGIAANLVDIWDWMILRPAEQRFKKNNPQGTFWGQNFYIHTLIDWIREHPFGWLPNLNENKKGVIVEIITIVLLWILNIYFLNYFQS